MRLLTKPLMLCFVFALMPFPCPAQTTTSKNPIAVQLIHTVLRTIGASATASTSCELDGFDQLPGFCGDLSDFNS